MSRLAVDGLTTMARIDLRTGWKVILAWVVGMVGMMAITASSISSLYPTTADLQGYAASLGDSMVMLNGRIAGIETLGGVMSNEYGFVVSFGIPLMAIAITGRATRKDEEAGRHEILLASRIGRHAPLLAGMGVAIVAFLVTGAGVAASMIVVGVPVGRAAAYGVAIAAMGYVFTGITAVAAQVFEHNRAVWGSVLSVTLVSYLARGVGALHDSALVLASPHGWVDAVRAFGAMRLWVLALPLVVGTALAALALWQSSRRDVGSALIAPRASKPGASALLRSPWGLAWHEHRGALIGWVIGSVALMGMYGSLTQEVVDALRNNPALGDYLGADATAATHVLLPAILSTFLMMLAMLVAAFAVMAIGSLRSEEVAGRVESELSGGRGRWAWIFTHLAVVMIGALVVGTAGSLAMGYGVAESLGDPAWVGKILRGSLWYAAPVAAFLALALALYGWRPRWQALAWVVFALASIVAYLGPGFKFPPWLVRATGFQAVGSNVLGGGTSVTGLVVVLGLALVLGAAGVYGFTRRDIPHT